MNHHQWLPIHLIRRGQLDERKARQLADNPSKSDENSEALEELVSEFREPLSSLDGYNGIDSGYNNNNADHTLNTRARGRPVGNLL